MICFLPVRMGFCLTFMIYHCTKFRLYQIQNHHTYHLPNLVTAPRKYPHHVVQRIPSAAHISGRTSSPSFGCRHHYRCQRQCQRSPSSRVCSSVARARPVLCFDKLSMVPHKFYAHHIGGAFGAAGSGAWQWVTVQWPRETLGSPQVSSVMRLA